MDNAAITITRKIGHNRGRRRLWIEGRALVEAGLAHGNRWDLIPTASGMIIIERPDGERKIAGTPDRPIIDIVGSSLGVLQAAEQVDISYCIDGGTLVVTRKEV